MSDTDTATNPLLSEFWIQDASVIDERLAEIRADGPTFFAEQPTEGIGLPNGPGAWVITQYDLILEMSKNPEIYSSAQGITVLDTPPEFNEFFSSMIAMDDPRHARMRRLVSKGFTPGIMKQLEDSVTQQADEIIDNIGGQGSCDFVVDVAARLPLRIVCDLMGVPRSDLDFVFDQSNIILGASDPEYVSEAEDVISALLGAGAALAELMTEVAESKRGGDGTDLTSILVNAELDGEKLDHSEIASFFILLAVAGNETTRNAISWGLHYLTENPDQRARWQADFEALAPTAVDEIVRLASPVSFMRRTATEDTTLGGVSIAKGDKLAMYYLAANRDEVLFPDPLRFDVGRNPNRHIGFGGPGPHFCLGAHLARREITVMFRELFRRLPDIEASGPPEVLQSNFIHGIKHLPTTFTPIR
ncbi:MAG: cytochrome P450 [Acidimicrobiales bacterium]|nr:cytochrome P450 [Acidimicrobiales bacterium]RZV46553.1 MAG: cytochrome P450 [Acidimicrobiales bacterium]